TRPTWPGQQRWRAGANSSRGGTGVRRLGTEGAHGVGDQHHRHAPARRLDELLAYPLVLVAGVQRRELTLIRLERIGVGSQALFELKDVPALVRPHQRTDGPGGQALDRSREVAAEDEVPALHREQAQGAAVGLGRIVRLCASELGEILRTAQRLGAELL